LCRTIEGGYSVHRTPEWKVEQPITMTLSVLQNANGGLGARHHAISTLQHTAGLEASWLPYI
jgi:hypothetical protein